MIRGEKIKYYREKGNFTQKELTTGICSIPYLSKVENNVLNPSKEILELLCTRLQITVKDVSPTETHEALKKEIYEWYEIIKTRDLSGSSHCLEKLSRTIKCIDDVEMIAFFNLMCARHFLFLKRYELAENYLTSAYSLIPYVPKSVGNFYFYFRGLYEYLNGNLEEALEFYKSIKDYMDEPEYFYQLSLIYTKLNKIPLSIFYNEKALMEFNKRILFTKVIDCYILLGINYNRIKEYDQAKDYLIKALNGGHSLKVESYVLGKIHHNLGCVYQDQKQSEDAIFHFLKAIDYKQNYKGIENTIYLLAKELFIVGDKKQSLSWIEQGLYSIGDTINCQFYLLKVLQFHVEGIENCKDYLELIKDNALPYFEKRKDILNMERSYILLAEYYSLHKQYKSSSGYLSKAYEIKTNQ